MVRFVVAAAVLLGAGRALANGHGSDTPTPPKTQATTAPARVVMTKDGPRMVDPKGMTLYYYERDTSGKTSSCEGRCAENWRPLQASSEAKAIGEFTVITRSDGTKMWAFRYRPLYTSAADKAPGESNGAATTMQWHVVRPDD
jgi:predicted lipoprotein with Yx(FWY)xxD motif